jgi:hypothetical protein
MPFECTFNEWIAIYCVDTLKLKIDCTFYIYVNICTYCTLKLTKLLRKNSVETKNIYAEHKSVNTMTLAITMFVARTLY